MRFVRNYHCSPGHLLYMCLHRPSRGHLPPAYTIGTPSDRDLVYQQMMVIKVAGRG